jgi:cytochrome c oxidase assembly protein Cox11
MQVRVEQKAARIAPGSSRALRKDSEQEELDKITLSYTMHPVREPEPAPAASVGSGRS